MKRLGLIFVVVLSLITLVASLFYVWKNQDVVWLFREAQELYAQGKEREAFDYFARVIEKDPNNIEAYRSLAKISRDQKDYAASTQFWYRVSKLDPTDSKVIRMQILNLLALGAHKSVIDLIEPRIKEGISEDKEEVLYLVQAYLFAGKTSEAEKLVDKLLKKYPGYFDGKLFKAHVLFIEGKFDEAQFLYKIISESENSVRDGGMIGLANCAIVNGEIDIAEGLFQKVSKSQENTFQARRILAEHYRMAGKLIEAKKEWQHIIAKYPESIEAAMSLAELYARDRDVEEIRNLAARVQVSGSVDVKVKRYLQAIIEYLGKDMVSSREYLNQCRDSMGERPFFQWMWFYASAILRDVDGTRQGVNDLRKIASGKEAQDRIIDVLVSEAWKAWLENDRQFARAIAKDVIKMDQKNKSARILLMREDLLLKDYAKAVQSAGSLLDDSGEDLAALEVRGRAYLEMGEIENAQNDFQTMQEIYPESHLGYYWQGVAFLRTRQAKNGRVQLEKALILNPDGILIITSLYDACMSLEDGSCVDDLVEKVLTQKNAFVRSIGYTLQAGAARSRGDIPEAIKGYELAILETPERIPYYLALSDLLVRQDRFAQAKEVLVRALRKDPNNKYIQFKVALWEQRQGNKEKAILKYRRLYIEYPSWGVVLVNLSDLLAEETVTQSESFFLAEDAVSVAAKWWGAHLCLANRLFERGRFEEAKKHFDIVLKIKPDEQDAVLRLREILNN